MRELAADELAYLAVKAAKIYHGQNIQTVSEDNATAAIYNHLIRNAEQQSLKVQPDGSLK